MPRTSGHASVAADGTVLGAADLWDQLDPSGPTDVAWARGVSPIGAETNADRRRVVVLLGAFDPPTNAHLAITRAATRIARAPAVLCLTKVLLARGGDVLLSAHERIAVIMNVAARCDIGVAFANRGTYLEVGRAMRGSGIDPTFIIGADKLGQLADPSFYEEGSSGVDATFAEQRFLVVPRDGIDVSSYMRGSNVHVLDTGDVFEDSWMAGISASDVRKALRSGRSIDHLVPPEVAAALRGYTSAR